MAISELYNFSHCYELNNYVTIDLVHVRVGRDAVWLVEGVRHGGTAPSGQGPK